MDNNNNNNNNNPGDYDAFLTRKKFQSTVIMQQETADRFLQDQEQKERMDPMAWTERRDAMETYKTQFGGNDEVRETAKDQMRTYALRDYLSMNDMKKAQKYDRIADPKDNTLDQIASTKRSSRKGSTRRKKAKEASNAYKRANEYKQVYAMEVYEANIIEHNPKDLQKMAVDGLSMLEESLKGMRLAAEAKSYSSDHENYRKCKSEVKIRGAQIKFIENFRTRFKITEGSDLDKYLKKQEATYKKKEKDYGEKLHDAFNRMAEEQYDAQVRIARKAGNSQKK